MQDGDDYPVYEPRPNPKLVNNGRQAKTIPELAGRLMYHGTTAKFSEFRKDYASESGTYGAGFYFTNDYELAKEYSHGEEPVAAYLSIQKPWVVDLDWPYDDEGTQAAKRMFRTGGARERLIEQGYDGVLVKQDDYLEAIVFEPSQIKIASMRANGAAMPHVSSVFDECFVVVREQFPDFGDIELHQDEKAGGDNGHGSERQFGYCADADGDQPICIAFASKTEGLPPENIRGLMAHEFGHALDYRYGKQLPQMLGVRRLPHGVERRADAIAHAVFGGVIEYDADDVQCLACQGVSPRPRRLGA